MEFTFENQGTSTYLVYSIAPSETIDTMSLGMLANNKIAGLAQVIYTQMDEMRYLKYNVSSKISVAQFFTGVVNKKRLLGVFSGIVDAMLNAEEYMIDTGSILLDLNYIFVDVTSCETVLVCLPIREKAKEQPDLGAMLKNIMFCTQFDQTENCDYVAKLINYLNSAPVFSLVDFKDIIDGLNINRTQVLNAAGADQMFMGQQQAGQGQASYVQQPASAAGQASYAQPQQATPPMGQPPYAQPQQPAPAAGQNAYAQQKIPPMGQPPYTQPQTVQAGQMPYARPPVPGANPGTAQSKKKKEKPPKNAKAPKQQNPAANSANGADVKPMSMFHLLSHYSKENAAIYKQQKEAKKGTQPVAPPAGQNFAVPGQPSRPIAPAGRPQQTVPVPPQQPRPAALAGQAAQAAQQTPYAGPNPGTADPYRQGGASALAVGRPQNFGETTVLGAGNQVGETTVLSQMNNPNVIQPVLVRCKTNERIPIDKPVFRIGKERSYVDYFIGDNTAISRSHANIISHDGAYYIMDTNSTNHTYVNGQMIQSNVETKLVHGTKIQLSNEEFEFRMYS